MATKEEFIPIENIFKMRYLEQYVQSVVNYSSRYNNQCNSSYAPINLKGKYGKYPFYGDFPDTYFLVGIIFTINMLRSNQLTSL